MGGVVQSTTAGYGGRLGVIRAITGRSSQCLHVNLYLELIRVMVGRSERGIDG